MKEPETWRLSADCPQCGHRWHPYGDTNMMVPATCKLSCPACKHGFEKHWYDQETQIKLEQKRLGLLPNTEEITNKFQYLEKKLSLALEELNLEKKKRELYESRLKEIEKWKDSREIDFQDIERIAEDLREDEKFREGNK